MSLNDATRNPKLELPSRESWGLKPERRGGSGWLALGALLLLAVLGLQVFGLLRAPSSSPNAPTAGSPGPSNEGGETSAYAGVPLKDLAAKLERNNLPEAAAHVLEEHLRLLPAAKAEERARTLSTIGDRLLDAGKPQEALVKYYIAEGLVLDTASREHIDRQVVACLEKLGKFDELAYELGDRSAPKGGPKPGTEAAEREVARLGVEPITASALSALLSEEIEDQLAAIPGISDEQKRSFRERALAELQEPQRRLQALQQIVARKVLYREGASRGLDRSSEVLRELDKARRELVARAVVREALKGVRITDGDLRLFFQAEGQRYAVPPQAKVRLAVLESEEAAKAALGEAKDEAAFERLAKERSQHAPTKAQGGQLEAPVIAGKPIPGLGAAPALAEAIFKTDAGQRLAAPVEVAGGWAIAHVQEKSPARSPSFDEVKEQVARDYVQRKELEAQDQLLKELFLKHAVNIHTEAFLSSEETETQAKAQSDPGAAAKPAPDPTPPPGAKPGD